MGCDMTACAIKSHEPYPYIDEVGMTVPCHYHGVRTK